MTPYVSIVIPLFNEAESVEKLVGNIKEVAKNFTFLYEIILVDDGSIDNTWATIEKIKDKVPELRAIKLRRNCGQTSAMVAGFDNSLGEIIVTMDGDLQNDPGDIPLLLTKIKEGYDIVSGWRKYRKDHNSRVIISKIANSIISYTTGVHLHDYGCSLKAYRAECIREIKAYGEMHRFFPALATMTGATVTEIPVSHYPRKYGKSKYGFERIIKVFSDILAINLLIRFASTPLKGFTVCSIPFILLFVMFALLSGVAEAFQWTSGKGLFFILSAALCAMAYIHLFAIGMLGELVVGTSDLEHTQLASVAIKKIEGDFNGKR